MFCRSFSGDGCCEDGEDRFGFWAGLWAYAGCDGCYERETARLCRVYTKGREAEKRLYANGGHIGI